jgi:hypothetical protein
LETNFQYSIILSNDNIFEEIEMMGNLRVLLRSQKRFKEKKEEE